MSTIPTGRATFQNWFKANVGEVDLTKQQDIAKLKAAGFSDADIESLKQKDGRHLETNRRPAEQSDGVRDKKITAEEMYLWLEQKDNNGTWARVDPNSSSGIRERFDMMAKLGGEAPANPTGQLGQLNAIQGARTQNTQRTSFEDFQNSVRSSNYLGDFSKMSEADLNKFFVQNPDWAPDREIKPSNYDVNVNKLKSVFDNPTIRGKQDLVLSKVQVPEGITVPEGVKTVTRDGKTFIESETHGDLDKLNIFKYNNRDGMNQPDVSRIVRPGEMAFVGLNHHLEPHLDKDDNHIAGTSGTEVTPDGMTQAVIKRNMTHLRMMHGVEQDNGKDGIVSTDVPLSYATRNKGGPVAKDNYAPILFKLDYPDYISPAKQAAYNRNVQQWGNLVSSLSNFPSGNYDGGDPLTANTQEKANDYGKNVMDAMYTGNDPALKAKAKRAFNALQTKENLNYCSEANKHLALNLGLEVPFNKENVTKLYGEQAWKTVEKIEKDTDSGARWKNSTGYNHRYGAGSGGELGNSKYIKEVPFHTAPDWLRPMSEEVKQHDPEKAAKIEARGTGFYSNEYMDGADMVRDFIKTYIPREDLMRECKEKGKDTAWIGEMQAKYLSDAKPNLYKSMGIPSKKDIDALKRADPAKGAKAEAEVAQVDQIYAGLVHTLGQDFPSYEAFEKALEEGAFKMAKAVAAGDEQGNKIFSPPHSLLSLNEAADHRVVSFVPIGHGLPESAVID